MPAVAGTAKAGKTRNAQSRKAPRRGFLLSDQELATLFHPATEMVRAEKMQISRATFGRIVACARRKTADALVSGKAIRIQGESGVFI